MGSPQFQTREVGRFCCTRAWFPPGAVLDAHIHDRATFAVMLGGSFDLGFVGGAIRSRDLDCTSGTVFTEPAGETHRNRIGTAGAEVVVLQVDPCVGDPTVEPFRGFLTDHINHFRHGGIGLQARRIAREIAQPDALSDLAIESLALDMLVQAGRRQAKEPAEAPPWLERAEDYARSNFRQALRIADVARAVGVHPAYLASLFRTHHGVPLGEFIRRLRLEWAADRLARTDDSLSSIAYAAGFADQAHLTRAFKGHTGQPPGAYRRMCR
jgi:AraC family transcriptional regulator